MVGGYNKKIKTFNFNLIKFNSYYDINTYYRLIHNNFFNAIDIDFMDFYLSIIENENTFIIDSNKLVELGIFDTLEIIPVYLELNGLVVDVDYQIKISQNEENQTEIYVLTADAFKLCAMSSPKTNKYRQYYLLFEKVHYFYIHYNNLFRIKFTNPNDYTNEHLMEEIKKLQCVVADLHKSNKRARTDTTDN